MKSSFCIDLQRFMLIPTKFPLSPKGAIQFEDLKQPAREGNIKKEGRQHKERGKAT